MNIRMSTKGKRPLRSLTPSDKIHAIQRIHDGESKASVARDIGVPESTLRGWCKNEDKLRFMSRQSVSDKLSADVLTDKLGGSGLIGGPPEKRQKLDPSLPLNFSSKLKYDEMLYKRSALNGLDYSTSKNLSELGFSGLSADYGIAFNGGMKNKVFGADISRQADPSTAAISPLSSLTHLSGLSGLTQSPLAISFNELTSNLNLFAQLNPGLAAMSGLNGLAASTSTLRNVKPKAQPQNHSPRSESGDRQQGLTVKNWAKQKLPTSSSADANYGLNLTPADIKTKMKCPSPSLAPSLGSNLPSLAAIPDDPLLYWLKSQQAMLGLSNLYPPPSSLSTASPPIRSSTPQQCGQHANTPPTAPAPLTPTSSSTANMDDKNIAWYNWCKAFGASLSSLTPNAVAAMHANSIPQQPPTSTTLEDSSAPADSSLKPPFENILFSHLTKDADSSSMQSSSTVDNMLNNESSNNAEGSGKPEDLSAKSNRPSPISSPLPTPAHSSANSPRTEQQQASVVCQSPEPAREREAPPTIDNDNSTENNVSDCKDVLDNLLYKINNNPNVSLSDVPTPGSASVECGSESDCSYNSDHNRNNNDENTSNNNNNHSNKTDEEERANRADPDKDADLEAIKHGEKFLQWLENCSNPRVTAVQLMQLRFLISAIKSGSDAKVVGSECNSAASVPIAEPDEIPEENGRNKSRRRK